MSSTLYYVREKFQALPCIISIITVDEEILYVCRPLRLFYCPRIYELSHFEVLLQTLASVYVPREYNSFRFKVSKNTPAIDLLSQ
jgi:hypothetical protein